MVAQDRLDPTVVAALAKDYRLLTVLESGGLGNVFLAEQVAAGDRRVAVKVFHRPLSTDPEFAQRLLDRASASQRIRHPHVVETYDCGRASDGSLYVAMELVEGPTLGEYLRARSRVPLAEVVEIVAQCCGALHAAHQVGIIHRNMKPLNIVLARRPDGAPPLAKIRDFSIAKVKDSGIQTIVGGILGTPSYMSYEQVSGLDSEQLDGRADIYSLALVAYEMLTGAPAFAADTPVACMMKHVSEMPASIRAERPDVPADVEAVIMRALEKDRDRRYRTAIEFAAALRAAARMAEPGPAFPPPWRRRIPATASA